MQIPKRGVKDPVRDEHGEIIGHVCVEHGDTQWYGLTPRGVMSPPHVRSKAAADRWVRNTHDSITTNSVHDASGQIIGHVCNERNGSQWYGKMPDGATSPPHVRSPQAAERWVRNTHDSRQCGARA